LNALKDRVAADIVSAMGVIPESFWDVNDDACDCTYQRIGMWTNPYLAETLEVRMCCIWKELYKLFPQHVRTTPAFKNYNTDEWVLETMAWNAEFDMPKSIWYRQLARQQGRPVDEIREAYAGRDHERPRGVARPVPAAPQGPSDVEMLFTMLGAMADEISELREMVNK